MRDALERKHRVICSMAEGVAQADGRQNVESFLQCALFLDSEFLSAATTIWEALGDPMESSEFQERTILRYVKAVVRFQRLIEKVGFLVISLAVLSLRSWAGIDPVLANSDKI